MNNIKNKKNNQVFNIINSLIGKIAKVLWRSKKVKPAKIIILQKIKDGDRKITPEESLHLAVENLFAAHHSRMLSKKIKVAIANKKKNVCKK